jgi:hypothetical protein
MFEMWTGVNQMKMKTAKHEVRNRSAGKTTTFFNLNRFAARNLFRTSCFVLAAGLLPAACSAAVINIAVNNPSFEDNTGAPITDWGIQPPSTNGGPGGSTEAYVYAPTAADYPGGIPGGTNVAHSDGPIIFQKTDYVVQPDTTYTFSILVGNSEATNDIGNYRVVLVADGLVITPDQTAPLPAAGQWVLATSTGTVSDDSELVGYPISVVLDPLGGFVDWDEPLPSGAPPAPEPASLAIIGAAGLYMLRRSR